MKFVLFFPGTFLKSLGFADNFQWSFFKIKNRCGDEVLPVLFKHFSFKQHHFETLTFFAIIKAGIDLDAINIS